MKLLLHCSKEKLCPVRVETNATFVVDLTKLNHADDIKAEHRVHNGCKTLKLVVYGNILTRVVSTCMGECPSFPVLIPFLIVFTAHLLQKIC